MRIPPCQLNPEHGMLAGHTTGHANTKPGKGTRSSKSLAGREPFPGIVGRQHLGTASGPKSRSWRALNFPSQLVPPSHAKARPKKPTEEPRPGLWWSNTFALGHQGR